MLKICVDLSRKKKMIRKINKIALIVSSMKCTLSNLRNLSKVFIKNPFFFLSASE